MAVIRVAVLNLFRRRIDSPTHQQQQPPSRFSSPAIYLKKAFVYSSKGFDDWEAEIALVCVQLHLTYVKCEFDTFWLRRFNSLDSTATGGLCVPTISFPQKYGYVRI